MRSKSTNFGQTAKIYQVSQILSTSFTVNWIFILDDSLLSKYQKLKIGNFYENSLRNEKKDGKMSFNPLGYSKEDFFEKIKKIKNKNGLIKVAADSLNAYTILTALRQQKQLDLITQFYVFPLIRAHDYLTARLKDQFPSFIRFSDKVDQIISVASDQIQKWRLKFQILRNFMSLSGASQERAYQWRIRLRACNNLKPTKYHQQLKQFEKFIADQIESRKVWDSSYQQRASSKRTMILSNLTNAIQKILKANETVESQQKAVFQEDFVQLMLKLYKDETIFYEIINQGLKRFTQKDFQWQRLALPLCLITKAIKMSYQKQSKNEEQSKNRYFTVWRGGKISQRQLTEILSNWQDNPFYQFFSFVSTSRNINVALNFLKSTKKQVKKYNCLFKFQVRRKNGVLNPIHQQFFNHGYCIFNESIDKNEQQVLLNALTVGKIIQVQQLSFNQLKNEYNISKSAIPEGEQHQKIPLITMQIGSFEDLFTNTQTTKTLNEQRKKNQDKIKYKSIIQHYIYTIDIMKKYQYFDFADAYELCNQMEKSYRYLQREVKQMVQKFQKLTQTPDEQKIRLVYEQSDYYSRLSDICRKLGKLSEALLYNENAIERIKQFQNIDKNKSYQLYQEKLNKMYLKSSQILIESHQYSQASRKIQSRIQQLQQDKDERQRQRNKAIICRLLLDLGVTNFKQGKLKQAQDIFAQSAQNIQKIYEFINYDYLNEETHFFKWVGAVFSDPEVSIFDGPQIYYNKIRTANIAAITAVYGGEQRLRSIKKSAKSLELQTSQVIVNHKEYFCDAKQYEELINEIQQKVDQKLKKEQKNIPQQIFLKKNEGQLSRQEQLQLVKAIKEKQSQNHYNRMKQQMNKQLLYEEKQNFSEIMQQQATILNQKEEIQKLRQTFWDNPNVYLDRVDQFKEQFNDLYLKKQEINRQKLLMLQSNDQITMQQLTQYYKNSVKSINNYIKQLQRLGYSQSAPKILQQYNSLIKLYIEINYSQDAKQKIEEVKRLADIKGQQKYYEMAVAYLRNGKIHASAAEIDFLIILEPSTSYKYEKMKSFRKEKIDTAIQEFEKAQGYFKNALIKNENGILNRSAYEAQPQQFELQIWIAKSYLIKYELSQEKQSRQILKNIDRILGNIYSGLKKLNHKDKFELHAETLEIEAIYHFRRAQYKKSLECFDECIKIRTQKFGDLNWQNTLTFIKVIYLFYMVESMQQRLMRYIQNLQKNYARYKNYPFYWKICLAHYYMSKQCENHQVQHVISYIEDSLIFMEKIGFAQEHFYRQYQLIYEIEYSSFYNSKKPFLNRPKLIKKQRHLKKEAKGQREEEDPSFDQLLQFTESNMMKSIVMRKNRSSYTKQTINANINNNPESYLDSKMPSIVKRQSQLPPLQTNLAFYDSGMSSGIRTRDSSGRISKRQLMNKSGMSTLNIDGRTHSRRLRQNSVKKTSNYLDNN